MCIRDRLEAAGFIGWPVGGQQGDGVVIAVGDHSTHGGFGRDGLGIVIGCLLYTSYQFLQFALDAKKLLEYNKHR